MTRRIILRTPELRARAVMGVGALPVNAEKPIEVVMRPFKRNRSLAQNSTLHAWLTAIATAYEEAYGERIAPAAWKEYLKRLYLGGESREVFGEVVTTTRSTASLSVGEFQDFLSAIDQWAVDQLQLFLPRGPDYEDAMGRASEK